MIPKLIINPPAKGKKPFENLLIVFLSDCVENAAMLKICYQAYRQAQLVGLLGSVDICLSQRINPASDREKCPQALNFQSLR